MAGPSGLRFQMPTSSFASAPKMKEKESKRRRLKKLFTCLKYLKHVEPAWRRWHLVKFPSELSSFILKLVNQKLFVAFLRNPNMMHAWSTLNIVVALIFDSRRNLTNPERERRMRNSTYILNRPWPSTLNKAGGIVWTNTEPIETGSQMSVDSQKRWKILLKRKICFSFSIFGTNFTH